MVFQSLGLCYLGPISIWLLPSWPAYDSLPVTWDCPSLFLYSSHSCCWNNVLLSCQHQSIPSLMNGGHVLWLVCTLCSPGNGTPNLWERLQSNSYVLLGWWSIKMRYPFLPRVYPSQANHSMHEHPSQYDLLFVLYSSASPVLVVTLLISGSSTL